MTPFVAACAPALQRHYRVNQLAELWGFSRATVRKALDQEPDVIRWSNPRPGKRKYESISVPESVALRVHERLCQQALQAQLATLHPPRVIHLRDLHAGVAQKPTHILKRNAGKQLPNRKRIAQAVRSRVHDAAA